MSVVTRTINNIMDTQKILTTAILAGAVISSAWIFNNGLQKTFGKTHNIEVKGTAERNIKSDLVSCGLDYKVSAPTLSEAFAKLAHQEQQIFAHLKNHGLEKEAWRFHTANMNKLYKKVRSQNGQLQTTNEVECYEIQKRISIKSKDVDGITKIARSVETLMGQGIEVRTSLSYYYVDLAPIKVELLNEATQNAYLRAQQLAKATKSQVGGLCQAKQGIFQITSVNSTESSDYGMYDTSSIMKTVRAVANVSFSIE